MAFVMDQFGIRLCVSINCVFPIQLGFNLWQALFAFWANPVLPLPFQFFEFSALHRLAAFIVNQFFRYLPTKRKEQF